MDEPPGEPRSDPAVAIAALEQRVEVLEKKVRKRTAGDPVKKSEFAWVFGVVGAIALAAFTWWQWQYGYLIDRLDLVGDVDTKVALATREALADLHGAPLFKYAMPFEDFAVDCEALGFVYHPNEKSCEDQRTGKTYHGHAVIYLTEPFPPK